MNDDKLPNVFTSGEDDKQLSLEEIMAADARDSAAEDKLLNGNRKKNNAKKTAIIGGGVALVIALGCGMVFLNPFGSDFRLGGNNDPAPVVTESAVPNDEFLSKVDPKDLVTSEEDFAIEKRFPVKMEDWQTIRASDQDFEEIRSNILESISDTNLASSAGMLPSESTGFTSDPSKQDMEDGTPNPLYSFWTAEAFSSEVGSYTERLLNPVFGGWELYQYAFTPASQFFDIELFSDMFVDDWRTNNTGTPFAEYVPVYADWGANDYGMSDVLLASGSRWFGEVVSSETEFVYNDEEQQYRATMVANVKFTAWSKDQQRLEKTGTLTLTLVPNVDNNLNSSGHKVLIESGSLKVDG